METTTAALNAVVDSFQTLADKRPPQAEMRERLAALIQRAGDIAVSADDEAAKQCIIETLRWSLAEVEAGRIAV